MLDHLGEHAFERRTEARSQSNILPARAPDLFISNLLQPGDGDQSDPFARKKPTSIEQHVIQLCSVGLSDNFIKDCPAESTVPLVASTSLKRPLASGACSGLGKCSSNVLLSQWIAARIPTELTICIKEVV